MNKSQLANKIWASANKMRSKIEANEYKDYILGFIFYKFLSDKELSHLRSIGMERDDIESITEENTELVDLIQQDIGYFISYDNLYSNWLAMGMDFSIANVRDALSAFDRKISPNHKKLFDGIFATLQGGLNKLGTDERERSSAVRDLISLIKDIPTDGRQGYDVLGFVYEYLIGNFAANAGKKAGEFYTPHEVSVLMSDIIAYHLRDQGEIRIYDPTSGSGSLLINIGKSVARHISNKDNIKYYAQELKQNTYNLTRMNLIMRGINPSNIEVRNGDTLKEDWPYFDENDPHGTYEPLYVDAVVSNPPYSQEWDPRNQENDPRYSEFGLAPKGCADYAFLLHDLYHVKPEGIMTIVLPHGVLYRGGSEYDIRKALIEKNHIDTIIGLPEKVFFGTGIATIIMVLKRPKTRPDENILFIDASHGFGKEGKNNVLRAGDIKKIVDAVTTRSETQDYAKLVNREIIRSNDYNLNITRYVDGSEKPEKYDLFATMFGGIPAVDLARLEPYWEVFPALKEELFTTDERGYSQLTTTDIHNTIESNQDVIETIHQYQQAFSDFSDFLYKHLVEPMLTLNISQTEDKITNELFSRLSAFPLIDAYQAYQFFSEEWTQIVLDLEVLQFEGMDAARAVDPNMVFKNDKEVQDGWVGRILPFDLVQEELLGDQLHNIKKLRERLLEIANECTQIIDSLTPEEQDKSILNNDNTRFVKTEVKNEVKRILASVETPEIASLKTFSENFPKGSSKKAREEKNIFIEQHPEIPWDYVTPNKNGYTKSQINTLIVSIQMEHSFPEDSFESKIIAASKLLDEETESGKQLSTAEKAILEATISAIKELDDETAIRLIRLKWITPLISSLERMPSEVITTLSETVSKISAKYATTYQDIATRITSSENRLYDMIGDLEGDEVDMEGLTAFRQTLSKGKIVNRNYAIGYDDKLHKVAENGIGKLTK